MKYCIDFTKKFMYLDEIDEIKIKIKKETKISPVFFMSQYSNKRIVLWAEEINENLIKDLKSVRKEHPDWRFTLCFDEAQSNEWLSQIKEADIPFYFQNLVADWDTLQGYLSYGVTDMYIIENLGFELDKVANLLHPKNVQIRTFPNITQTTFHSTPSLRTFFIRPEDIPVYEEFVDVCEFYGTEELQNTYYRIYAKDKKWFGPLKEVIIGFEGDLDSRFILPIFGARRVKCGKKCFKGGTCKICDRILSASETLKDVGLMIKTSN